MAVGDVNGDGTLDLVAADGGSVLLGDGDGGFHDPQAYATGGAYGPIALADFNGDGRLDIAMTTDCGERHRQPLPRPRQRHLRRAEHFAVGSDADPGIAAGDFNGDGWLDVATANDGSARVSVLHQRRHLAALRRRRRLRSAT